MSIIQLEFASNPQLTGLAIGDSVYYIDNALSPASSNDVVHIGTVSAFSAANSGFVYIDTGSLLFNMPTANDYVFFSKNNNVNMSELLGYYAEMKLVNDSTDEAELHSLSVSINESSK
tara:strand:+ start:440 stop:793 length:354 start_codon:yes stop_codon:yes gene_type:complete